MDPVEFVRLATAQGHVVTPDTRRRLGMSREAWAHALSNPGVQRPHRGVAVLPGSADANHTRARAALSALQCRAALTGWSAAHLYGLVTTAPTEVHLLLDHGASVTRRDGLHLTETSAFPARVERIDGLPAVPVARVLADLAPTTSVDALRNLGIDARFAGHMAARDLDRELAARRRFPGRRRLRTIADDLRDDGSDSGFEFRTRDRLTDLDLPPDPGQLHVRIAGRDRRIDLGWQARHVGIECLGLAAHSGRRAFDRDATRRNDFAEDGSWTLLELTWTAFHTDWPAFVARLRRLLGR